MFDIHAEKHKTRIGLLYALSAFTAWGFVPLYFKTIAQVPALETLAHRIVWACIFLACWLHYKKRWPIILHTLRNPLLCRRLLASTIFIGINWGVFIWAINAQQVLQTSLGYFINPMVNIFLAWIFLQERLRKVQWVAVLLAAAGTLNLLWQYGEFPWVAFCLAFSFGFYGLLRKTTAVESLPGLFIETLMLAPLAIGYLSFLEAQGTAHLLHTGWQTDMLLCAAGLITMLPLLWFGNAARRLRLSTLGFCQYIAPSISFMLAVFLFKEPFTHAHLITFSCIWAALAIFSIDALRYR